MQSKAAGQKEKNIYIYSEKKKKSLKVKRGKYLAMVLKEEEEQAVRWSLSLWLGCTLSQRSYGKCRGPTRQ